MPFKPGKRILLLALPTLALAGLMYWSTATERPAKHPDIRFSHHANVSDHSGAQLLWEPCDHPPAIAMMTVGCGWLGFRDEYIGETWIPIAVFSPDGAVNTPVLYLPGGPGSSAWLESFGLEGWAYWWQSLDTSRDLVVFDPRGTGVGLPTPQCDRLPQERTRHLGLNLGPDQEELDMGLALILCADEMRRQGTDLRGFSTARMTEDVGLLVRLLQTSQGYSHFHLYGISYGTRLALQISRHRPDWLESMVLDGLYPPDEDSLLDWPRFLDAMRNRIDQTCMNTPWCREHFGDTGVPVISLAHQLQETPVTRTILWEDGRSQRVVLNGSRLLEALAADVYTNEILPFLPWMISRFIDGEEGALDVLLWNLLAFEDDPSFNRLIFAAVECQDSPLPNAARWQKILDEHPHYKPFIHKNLDEKRCAHMRLPHAAPEWRTLAQNDTPTLLVSATLDTVTPPANAERIGAYLPRSQHLVVTPGTHGTTFDNLCAQAAMRAFWAGDAPADACGEDFLPMTASRDADKLDALIQQTADFWGNRVVD